MQTNGTERETQKQSCALLAKNQIHMLQELKTYARETIVSLNSGAAQTGYL